MNNIVKIEVIGGVAHLVEKPDHVTVIIVDHDNTENSPKKTIRNVWTADDIKREAISMYLSVSNDDAKEIAEKYNKMLAENATIKWDTIMDMIIEYGNKRKQQTHSNN